MKRLLVDIICNAKRTVKKTVIPFCISTLKVRVGNVNNQV